MNVRRQSLRKDFSWALSGNVVYSGCQWGIVLLLARLGSPEHVGEYALALAITAPILLFCNFQLRALVSSDVTHRHSFEQYLAFRLGSLGVAILVVIGVVGFAGYPGRLAGTIVLAGGAQALDLISDFYYGVMQTHGRMDRISRSLMMKGPLALAALAIGMYVGRAVFWALAGMVTVRLAILLFFDSSLGYRRDLDAEVAETAKPKWAMSIMAGLLKVALPLGFISMLVSLNASLVPYFIAGELNKRALGIFSALYSLQGAGSLVMSALGQATFVSLARAYSLRDGPQFKSLLFHLMCVAIGLGSAGVIGTMIIGQSGLAILFKAEYGSYVGVFVRIMFAAGITYLGACQGYALTAMHVLTPQVPVLLLTVCATVTACLICIPRHGINGAADACIISASVQCVGNALLLARRMAQEFGTSARVKAGDETGSVFAN